jgi:hypothetical protein
MLLHSCFSQERFGAGFERWLPWNAATGDRVIQCVARPPVRRRRGEAADRYLDD